ncbi:MAG: sugar transferase, partial [Bacillus sp. (in: Bacteria)]|nr:sugar transferase [Bacillus sp. (in: firmicutes)]
CESLPNNKKRFLDVILSLMALSLLWPVFAVIAILIKLDSQGSELGWKAEKSLKDMCRDSWNWQKKNPDGYDD